MARAAMVCRWGTGPFAFTRPAQAEVKELIREKLLELAAQVEC